MYSIISIVLLITGLFQINNAMIITSGLFAIASAINYLASKVARRTTENKPE